MLAMESVEDRASKMPDAARTQRILSEARNGSPLVIACGVHRNVGRFLAPLVMTEVQTDEALAILSDALVRC